MDLMQIVKAVMSLVEKAELGATYLNAQEAVYERLILHELGHPQQFTKIVIDNTTTEGLIKHKIQPRNTKAMDMRFHWICNQDARSVRIHLAAREGELCRLH